MSNRISTFSQSQYITNQVLRLEGKYANLTTQSSSGLKAQTFGGISQDAQNFLNLRSQYTSIASQTTNAKNASFKLNNISSALSNISSVITSARTNLSTTISNLGTSTSSAESIATELKSYLDQIVGSINTQYAGKYVFGGSRNDSLPIDVDDVDYTSTIDIDTPSTAYYQGNTDIESVQVNDTLSISYGLTADNPAFEKLIRSLKAAIANPTDSATLNKAYNLLSKAADGVGELSSITLTRSQLLENQIGVNEQTLDYINTNLSELTDADLTTVSVQLSSQKTQIDATYSSLANLLKLRLTDYLK
jgi:flagellar hook-associated protein 3 FlgL